MNKSFLRPAAALLMVVGLAQGAGAFAATQTASLTPVPAVKSPIAAQSPILAATFAADRVVSDPAPELVPSRSGDFRRR